MSSETEFDRSPLAEGAPESAVPEPAPPAPEAETSAAMEWDMLYRSGTPPWETGRPSSELVRVLGEGLIKPCRVLELGCGTGADAIYLARRRFEVTALDFSPTAVERARTRAEREGALLRLVLDDVFEFGRTCGAFEFIYEAGFYHFFRRVDLNKYLDLLWRVTQPGSYYLSLAGNDEEQAEGGPPAVSRDTILNELGRLFELVHLRPFRFASPVRPEGFLGWSCLMRRPKVG